MTTQTINIPLSFWFSRPTKLAVPLFAIYIPSLPCDECGKSVNIHPYIIETNRGCISLKSMLYNESQLHPTILCDDCLSNICAFKFSLKTTINPEGGKIISKTGVQNIDFDIPCHACSNMIIFNTNDLHITETQVVLLNPMDPLYCMECLSTIISQSKINDLLI